MTHTQQQMQMVKRELMADLQAGRTSDELFEECNSSLADTCPEYGPLDRDEWDAEIAEWNV